MAVDIAISASLFLIKTFIFPGQKKEKEQDSIPNINFGDSLPFAWGTTIVNGALCFYLDPSLNDRVQIDKYNFVDAEKAASYAVFLHVNPSNSKVRAIRVSGAITATDIPSLPLNPENKSNKDTDSVTQLSKFDNFKFRYLNGSQLLPDRVFLKAGFTKLVYHGQVVIVVDSALRSLYGGRGSSVSAIVQNKAYPPGTTNSILGFGDHPASVKINNSYSSLSINGQQALGGGTNVAFNFTLPRGYQDSYKAILFDSDFPNLTPATYKLGLFASGTYTDFYLTDDETSSIVNSPSNSTQYNAGQKGLFGRVDVSLVTPLYTNKVIVVSLRSEAREVTTLYGISPFYSENGVIKESNGTKVQDNQTYAISTVHRTLP